MALFVKDKSFYRQLLMIAVPVALQNLINFSVSMADTVMLGRLGEIQMSAAAHANQLGFIYGLFTFGVGSGCNVLIAQFWGKQDRASIHKVVTIMYRLLLGGGILFSILGLVFTRQIISIFTTDAVVIEEGVRFLRIIAWSYLLMGFSSTTVIMLRSVGAVRIAIGVYLSSLCVNVFFNWVLIFGKLGAPALGIEGAAYATCIARVVEIAIVLFYMIRVESKIKYKIKYFFMRKMGIIREFAQTAFPVLINELLWGTGSAMIAVIIGRMGTEVTAANVICSTLSQLVTITIFGVGNASAVIIGNTVGAGEYGKAKEYGNTLMVVSLLLGLVSSLVVTLLKWPMISFYDISETTRGYAAQIITVYSVVVIFQAFAAIALIGVLRGGGDTRFVLLMDVVFMWMIGIPLGFLTGLKLQWPVVAVYAVIKSDEVFKTAFSFTRVKRGKWINDITQTPS